MKVVWQVEDNDVSRVKEFYNRNKNNDLVVGRRTWKANRRTSLGPRFGGIW